jgi:hypothetical protein
MSYVDGVAVRGVELVRRVDLWSVVIGCELRVIEMEGKAGREECPRSCCLMRVLIGIQDDV